MKFDLDQGSEFLADEKFLYFAVKYRIYDFKNSDKLEKHFSSKFFKKK